MEKEKVLLHATLCYPIQENQVLLAYKTAKIGKDKWIGYGGGIEENESPEQSAVRELEEESGLVTLIEDLIKVGVIYFHNITSDGNNFTCKAHIYLIHQWNGDLRESETMIRPTWFNIDNLPLEEMMPADRIWLPPILNGKKIKADAFYGPYQEKLLKEVRIEEVNSVTELT